MKKKGNKMAKVILTIEDNPDRKTVKIVSNPTFETMAKMIQSGESMSDAHGYALAMIRTAREIGKEKGPTKIWLPRQGR